MQRSTKIMLGLVAVLIIAIAVLILSLPHTHVTKIIQTTTNQISQLPPNTPSIATTIFNPLNTTTTITTTNSTNQTIYSNTTVTTTVTYAYCVGSPLPLNTQAYYAGLYTDGIPEWKPTTSYPVSLSGGSCTTYNNYTYCVGNSFSSHNTEAYYAPVSSNGIGGWNKTTSYPIPFNYGSCASYNGYIYCVGDLTSNKNYSNETYYASISATGIGQWARTTNYPSPFFGAQCSINNGYIYCMGNAYISPKKPNITITKGQILSFNYSLGFNSYNYYAPISNSGIGSWNLITQPPTPMNGASCQISNNKLYCVGGFQILMQIVGGTIRVNSSSVNTTLLKQQLTPNGTTTSATIFAPIKSDGSVGAWIPGSPYPTLLQNAGCIASVNAMYCIGSFATNSTQSVYFANLSTPGGFGGWQQTEDYPTQMFNNYCTIRG